MYDIISIGSATFDVFIKSKKFPLDKMMVGEKIEAEEFLCASGGGGSNTAAGFSRMGLNTACIARFGDDLFGQFVRADLEKESFDKKYLLQKKGDVTDYSTILVNPDGSRIILVSRGKTRIEQSDFPWEALKETKYLYIASLEGNVDLLEKVVNLAIEQSVKVILNPGSRELKEKEKLTKIFPKLFGLILNREEADSLGLKVGPAFAEASAGRPEMVIITSGRQGAKLFSKEKNLLVESFQVKAIDETGAGDAFSSGFVSGLVKGWNLEKSLKLGMADGCSVVTKIGAKPGLLNESECKDWLSKNLRIEQIN